MANRTEQFVQAVKAHLPRKLNWLLYLIIIAMVFSWVPLALIAKARVTHTPKAPVHIFLDMDQQPKYKAQASSELFAAGRAMQEPIAGTIARGELFDDMPYYKGQAGGKWAAAYPPQVKVDKAFVERGRQRFNIYCAVCHGSAGQGDGPVARRVQLINDKNLMEDAAVNEGWVAPSSLHTEQAKNYELGFLFNTISNGIRTMPGYKAQIPVEDRWAIVAYVKVLQSLNLPAPAAPAPAATSASSN